MPLQTKQLSLLLPHACSVARPWTHQDSGYTAKHCSTTGRAQLPCFWWKNAQPPCQAGDVEGKYALPEYINLECILLSQLSVRILVHTAQQCWPAKRMHISKHNRVESKQVGHVLRHAIQLTIQILGHLWLGAVSC